jgi:hypothetical protein
VHGLQEDVDRVPGEVMRNEDLTTKEQLGRIDALMKRLQVSASRVATANPSSGLVSTTDNLAGAPLAVQTTRRS